MGLREWSVQGIFLSPFIIYLVLAFAVTGVMSLIIQFLGLNKFIWHEALFNFAVFICVLSLLTIGLGKV